VTTSLENLEMTGNLIAGWETSGNWPKYYCELHLLWCTRR